MKRPAHIVSARVGVQSRLNDHPKHTRHRACSAAALKELCFFDAKYPACSAKRPGHLVVSGHVVEEAAACIVAILRSGAHDNDP